MKYYNAWKYLRRIKNQYPEINLDKIESKINTIRKNGKVLIDGKRICINIVSNPGKIDLVAKFIDITTEHSINFVGIKLKGKFNTAVRKLFHLRPYFKAKNIYIGGISIIFKAKNKKIKRF